MLGNINSKVEYDVGDVVAYELINKRRGWDFAVGVIIDKPLSRVVYITPWQPKQRELTEEETRQAKEMEATLRQQAQELHEAQESTQKLAEELMNEVATIDSTRREVERRIDAVKPIIEEAEREINTIKDEYLREMRSYPTPPDMVRTVLEAVMIILGDDPFAWEVIKAFIRADDFMTKVHSFKAEQLSHEILDRLQAFKNSPKFTYENANRASKAAGPLLKWVLAQLEAAEVHRSLVPQKEYAEKLSRELGAKDAALQRARIQLAAIESSCDGIQRQLDRFVFGASEVVVEGEEPVFTFNDWVPASHTLPIPILHSSIITFLDNANNRSGEIQLSAEIGKDIAFASPRRHQDLLESTRRENEHLVRLKEERDLLESTLNTFRSTKDDSNSGRSPNDQLLSVQLEVVTKERDNLLEALNQAREELFNAQKDKAIPQQQERSSVYVRGEPNAGSVDQHDDTGNSEQPPTSPSSAEIVSWAEEKEKLSDQLAVLKCAVESEHSELLVTRAERDSLRRKLYHSEDHMRRLVGSPADTPSNHQFASPLLDSPTDIDRPSVVKSLATKLSAVTKERDDLRDVVLSQKRGPESYIEDHKLLAEWSRLLAIGLLFLVVTCMGIAFSQHVYTYDQPPASPDAGFLASPDWSTSARIDWPNYLAFTLITLITIGLLVRNKNRFVVMRRLALMLGFGQIIQFICLFATRLPDSNVHLHSGERSWTFMMYTVAYFTYATFIHFYHRSVTIKVIWWGIALLGSFFVLSRRRFYTIHVLTGAGSGVLTCLFYHLAIHYTLWREAPQRHLWMKLVAWLEGWREKEFLAAVVTIGEEPEVSFQKNSARSERSPLLSQR